MIGRFYFGRQTGRLLKFARSTADPQLAAVLTEKAADLKSQSDETPPPAGQEHQMFNLESEARDLNGPALGRDIVGIVGTLHHG